MSEKKAERTVHATHVRQKIYGSTLEYAHEMPTIIDRLVVDMSHGMNLGPWLVIYFYEDRLGSFMITGSKKYKEMKFEPVREVEISDDLFMTAIELHNLHQRVKSLGLNVAFRCLTAGTD